MSTALLLVDIQNDYFPGGRNGLFEPEKAAENAAMLLRTARDKGLPVVHVQHVSPQAGATFFLPETQGVQIHPAVQPKAGEDVVVKHKPDSFLDTNLQDALAGKGIARLVVCGMMSHMCIDTTVRSAKAKGYEILLAHDACATKTLEWLGDTLPAPTVHAAFMAALQGTFATVVPTSEAIGQL